MFKTNDTVHGKIRRAFFILASDLVSAIGRGWIYPRSNETLSPIKVTAGRRSGTATVHHRKKQRTVNLNSKLGDCGDRIFFVAYADGHSEIHLDREPADNLISRVLSHFKLSAKYCVEQGAVSTEPNSDFTAFGRPTSTRDPLSGVSMIFGGMMVVMKDTITNEVINIVSRRTENELRKAEELDIASWLFEKLAMVTPKRVSPLDYLPAEKVRPEPKRRPIDKSKSRPVVQTRDLRVTLGKSISKPVDFNVVAPKPSILIEATPPAKRGAGTTRKPQGTNRFTESFLHNDRKLRNSIGVKAEPKKLKLSDLNLDRDEIREFITQELRSRPAQNRNGDFFEKPVVAIPLIDTSQEVEEDDGYRRNKKGMRILGSRRSGQGHQSQLGM